MKTLLVGNARIPSTKTGIVVALVLGLVLASMFIVSPARAAPAARFTPANGNVQQWAFGGSAGGHFSCSNQGCLGNVTVNGTVSLSYQYYIEWVVIYTVTNVSSTQTMVEIQSALNATASFSLNECIQNGTGPCQPLSASLNLNGQETSTGFTNITNGTVDLTAAPSGPLGPTAAQAIKDASSNEAFNFSGSESVSGYTGSGSGGTGSASFDFGGHEVSSVTFSTPLGVVPVNPQPGDQWTASAPFSATGSWTTGYSITTSVSGYSASNWTSGTLSPSGTETVNGTDLGQFTLYDNYTNPPTVVTAQEILLDFGNGVFDGADGWLLVPSDLFGGIYGGLLGFGLSTPSTGPMPAISSHPSASTLTGAESAYYQHGVGFIGAAASGNTTGSIGGATAPTIKLKAGPEPVSVAQQQYGAITSPSGGSSSSFPWIWVVIAVVVVVVVLALVMVTRRRRGRQPSTMAAGQTGPTPAGAPVQSAPGSAPAGPAPPGPAAAPMPPAAPVCPNCGQPGTYISQYGRYYCYQDKQYL
jgi:hypothetical protein